MDANMADVTAKSMEEDTVATVTEDTNMAEDIDVVTRRNPLKRF
jgi:hypothetical protein